MATFKEIRGQLIKKYTTNPTNPLEGQMWYNNTTGTLKVYTQAAAAWASGTVYPVGAQGIAGCGATATTALTSGGQGPAPVTVNTSNTYDGSSWTGAPTIPTTSRTAFMYGTQTAGLYSGGNTTPGQNPVTNASAEYDGSTWTGAPAMPSTRSYGGSVGIQTSALSVTGDDGGWPGGSVTVDSYNGSTWATETAYPTKAYGMTGCGTSETEAFVAGGQVPYPGGNPSVATYNGTAWTLTATPLNTLLPANGQQMAKYGTSTNALAFGGASGQTATASWNGTAWASQPNMGTGRIAGGGAGTAASALAVGGDSPGTPYGDQVEEFTGAALEIQTVTTS